MVKGYLVTVGYKIKVYVVLPLSTDLFYNTIIKVTSWPLQARSRIQGAQCSVPGEI